MKKISLYIPTAVTLLFSLFMIFGGVIDIIQPKGFEKNIEILGYPVYFFVLLGIAKIIGGVLLNLKKWVHKLLIYFVLAGFIYDITFAILSHIITKDYVSALVAFIFLLIIFYITTKYKS